MSDCWRAAYSSSDKYSCTNFVKSFVSTNVTMAITSLTDYVKDGIPDENARRDVQNLTDRLAPA